MSDKQSDHKRFSLGTWGWRARLALLFSGMLAAGMAPALENPTAFVKAVTIRQESGSSPHPALMSGKTFDIRGTLQKIPYRATVTSVNTSQPERRYRETILQGNGNCSQMTAGLAQALNKQGIDYEVVSILPRDKVLQGWGHTLLRLPYSLDDQRQVGLLDIYGGGPVISNGRLADVEALWKDAPQRITIRPLNARAFKAPQVVYPAILEDSVIGFTDKAEIERQFKFLNTFAIPLGHPGLEGYFYRFVTLIGGFYPTIHVRSLNELLSPANQQLRLAYLACLWLIRLSLAGLAALSLITALGRIRSWSVSVRASFPHRTPVPKHTQPGAVMATVDINRKHRQR